jgi:putative transposase
LTDLIALIISFYSRGRSVSSVQQHIEEIYDVEVSPQFISTVTDAVVDEVKQWQNRPLERVYPTVYLDALRVNIKENGTRVKKSVYLAIGVNMLGYKEVLGLWIGLTEGAKFWLGILTELKNRGVEDIFIACIDGLTGFVQAIETSFPRAKTQLCIVHVTRNSLSYVSYKDRKEMASDLKLIYNAPTLDQAEWELECFGEKWGKRYPMSVQIWKSNWANIVPFFEFPPEIRKAIYTTNVIESLNYSLRKIIKNRSSFPSDEAASKLLYLALRNASRKWTRPIQDWKAAINQFAIHFEGRVLVP